MRKLSLLILFLAVIAPLKSQALITTDETLSYVAMPLAVSDVTAVRGVQTDQVAQLVTLMDEAQVSPQGFIDVFRYVPVALVYNNGNQTNFVNWVQGQINDGVTGDRLVTVMERRLTTYGNNVVRVSEARSYVRPQVVFERDYVPAGVTTYVERQLVEPFALIDMPLAVDNVVALGVPFDRVGNFVV